MNIMRLAVIGTAGRGEDASKLNAAVYARMCDAVRAVVALEGVNRLVSGGAAWADHCAVTVGLEDSIPTHLFLPEFERDREIALYYHKAFSHKLGRDTASERNACTSQMHGGFKDRNTLVANAANVFLAMTFGDRARVKDGGTADTVGKMLARGIHGYHLDLNTMKLHNNATI